MGENKYACVMCVVWETDGDLEAETEETVLYCSSLSVSSSSLVLFCVFTVSRSKHRCCLFPLRLQQTERSLQAAAAAAVTVFVVEPSNYYTAPTFIQLLPNTHILTHAQSIIISLYVTALNNKNYTP